MASLFVIQGRDQGKRFELDAPFLGLGRDSANAVQLRDTEVSRLHAEVRRNGDQFQLLDLHSSNGTFVNSHPIETCTLSSGDRVQIGRTLMIFTDTADQTASRGATDVDIIARQDDTARSRIVKSVSHEEGSGILSSIDASDGPWLARARSNLQVMYRTALAVSHTLDIDQLLQRIMELIFEWVEADRGCVMLVDQETDELQPTVRHNRPGVKVDDKLAISRTILDFVLQRREGVLTSDAREDDRWDAGGSIVTLGVREAICVPMQGRYGVVGVIYIDTYTPPGRVVHQHGHNRFSEEHLKLMVAIGHQAALAVEDTSYYSAMVQAERLAAIGQTIATLSHHIKNILQGIRGGSYLIEEGLRVADNGMLGKGWAIVEKNQEKISQLVMDMLTFSKEREPDMAPEQLNDTVRDVAELMQSRAQEVGVQLDCCCDEAMPVLLFDAEAMHRATLNVVTNAIDACQQAEHPLVTMATKYLPKDGLAQIIVRDNGDGIEPEDLKRIFVLFESRKGGRGTGLGLSVSQKILHEHEGEIRVTSQPGHGSQFTLELPAIAPESRPTTGASSESP